MIMRNNLTAKDICRVAIDFGRSNREVGRLLEISPSTVAKYRNLMMIHKIDDARLRTLSDMEVEELVQARYRGALKNFIEPDWDYVCAQSDKRDVTVGLLYQEYVESSADLKDGASLLSESSFTRRLREAKKNRRLSMRQAHLPGAETFVDFSGKHLYLTDPKTRKKCPVEIFVASLGASQLLFATAVPSQKVPDWIEANVRAIEYYGGVTRMIIPDNLKSAVTTPRRRGRGARINRTYLDFSQHYEVTISPARSLHPQDKSLAEIGVRIVNIWVIAALRNRVFHTLTEMNLAIAERVTQINNKQSRRLGSSRRERFEEIEKAALGPLPKLRYEVVEWEDSILVPRDYHIACRGDYYSVPHGLVGQRVNCAVSRSTIRIFTAQSVNPVAVHSLGRGDGATFTDRKHMPDSHRYYAAETVGDLFAWADSVGEEVCDLFNALQANRRITPLSALRQMARAKRLAREYGLERFLSACKYANSVGTQTIDSVRSILKHKIDLRNRCADDRIVAVPVHHENVRGATAYKGSDHAE